MKKNLIYIFFLIILPVSFGNSDHSGCNRTNKKSENCEKVNPSNQANPPEKSENSQSSNK